MAAAMFNRIHANYRFTLSKQQARKRPRVPQRPNEHMIKTKIKLIISLVANDVCAVYISVVLVKFARHACPFTRRIYIVHKPEDLVVIICG